MSFNLSANENKGNWNRRIGKSQPLFVYFRPFHTQFDGIQNKKKIRFLKNGPIPASFCLFSLFSHYNFNNTN